MSFYGRFSGSISQWETSYFGGYERVLYDHPPVTVPKEIVTVLPVHPRMYVPYYTRQKLVDMFLYKVSMYPTITTNFINNTEKILIEGKPFMKVTPKGVKLALRDVVDFETELGSLFEYYKDFISDTSYLFEVDEKHKEHFPGSDDSSSSDSKDDDGKSDDREGESDGDKENEIEKKELKKLKAEKEIVKGITEALKQIVERKTYSDSYKNTSLTNPELKKNAKFVTMKKDNKPCTYTNDEISMSNKLLNLLDISFDPKSDRVNNLKTGKLDVSKIAEIPSGNTHVYYTIEENQSTKPFSVCILADESGSMDGRRLRKQYTLLKVLYNTFSKVLPKDKIYVFGHSGGHTPEIRVYNDRYFDGFELTINNQKNNEFNENYDGPVIERVYEKVRSQTSDNIIFISISDGYPSGANYGGTSAINGMKKIIEKCKRDGFVTVGIGIDCGLVKEIYQYHVVVDSDNNDKMLVSNISTLINRVVKTEFQS